MYFILLLNNNTVQLQEGGNRRKCFISILGWWNQKFPFLERVEQVFKTYIIDVSSSSDDKGQILWFSDRLNSD